jgi:hypothetical protein
MVAADELEGAAAAEKRLVRTMFKGRPASPGICGRFPPTSRRARAPRMPVRGRAEKRAVPRDTCRNSGARVARALRSLSRRVARRRARLAAVRALDPRRPDATSCYACLY